MILSNHVRDAYNHASGGWCEGSGNLKETILGSAIYSLTLGKQTLIFYLLGKKRFFVAFIEIIAYKMYTKMGRTRYLCR
jgi:hypothetical protein